MKMCVTGGSLQKICFTLQNRGWLNPSYSLERFIFKKFNCFFSKRDFTTACFFERIFFDLFYSFWKEKNGSKEGKESGRLGEDVSRTSHRRHDWRCERSCWVGEDRDKGVIGFWVFSPFSKMSNFCSILFQTFFKFYSFEKNVESKMNYFSEFGDNHLQVETGQSGAEDDDWCWWGGHRDVGWKKQGDFFIFSLQTLYSCVMWLGNLKYIWKL